MTQPEANETGIPQVSEILERLEELGASQDELEIADIQDALGRDAFGPSLLMFGLLSLSPLGDVPGGPTVLGIGIVAIATQMAIGRDGLWLPKFIAKRTISASHLQNFLKVLRPVLNFVGHIFRPRWSVLTEGAFARGIALVCGLLALSFPPLEVVPFGATVPAVIITILSLALVARDGFLVVLSLGLIAGGIYWAFTRLL